MHSRGMHWQREVAVESAREDKERTPLPSGRVWRADDSGMHLNEHLVVIGYRRCNLLDTEGIGRPVRLGHDGPHLRATLH